MPEKTRSAEPVLANLALILVSTRNPLNIGAVARAMGNFGFGDLRAVNPYELSFREAQSAVGAAEVLAKARVYTSVADAIEDCSLVIGTTAARNRNLEHQLKSLPEAGSIIRAAMRSGQVALLFGSEKRGLSNHDFSYCHWLLRIPTVENTPAMNLGQAVALCLYEVIRGEPRAAKSTPLPTPTALELERLCSAFIESLEISGYLKQAGTASDESIRRLVRRLHLSKSDSSTLLGMLRQMLWKMQNSTK